MNTKKLLLFLFILFVMPFCAHAENSSCSDNEKLRLRQLVSNVDITYKFINDSGDALTNDYYNVTMSNFTSDFYAISDPERRIFQYSDNSVITETQLTDGIYYTFNFYASSSNVCSGYLIGTKIIYLPNYNSLSQDPLCKGHEEYELCKEFTEVTVPNYDEFVKRVKAYISSLNNSTKNNGSSTNNNSNTQQSWLEVIESFFINNYMIILIAIIVLCVTGIVVIEVRKHRSIL